LIPIFAHLIAVNKGRKSVIFRLKVLKFAMLLVVELQMKDERWPARQKNE